MPRTCGWLLLELAWFMGLLTQACCRSWPFRNSTVGGLGSRNTFEARGSAGPLRMSNFWRIQESSCSIPFAITKTLIRRTIQNPPFSCCVWKLLLAGRLQRHLKPSRHRYPSTLTFRTHAVVESVRQRIGPSHILLDPKNVLVLSRVTFWRS